MSRIILSDLANDDLDKIWDYIAIEKCGSVAADLLIDEFDRRFRLAATQPMMGQAVENLRPNARRIVVRKRYLVFYEPVEDGIIILRVLHGARLIRPSDLSTSV